MSVMSSSSPSPSPTPPPASAAAAAAATTTTAAPSSTLSLSLIQQQQQQQQSSTSPLNSQQLSTKPGALVSLTKSLLSEQSQRLSLKHQTDIELLDDLRNYLKQRCILERDYSQSLNKLNVSYSKRTTSSTFFQYILNEDENSDVKTIYSSWKIYQDEMEKHAKNRQQQFEQLLSCCETLKQCRQHKIQIAKKCLDNYLKKMHEEIINSVNEIDKTRKLYFEEEHLAKQARDKEEKIKKRKTGIFASFTNLQNKRERSSAHREASDIQSTQARNDYIMALAAGNAHLDHYYNHDLLNLILQIDDCLLDKCRSNILNLLNLEKDLSKSWQNCIDTSIDLFEHTSADYTNQIFLKDPNSSSLLKTLSYEFQPCDNDPIDTISLDHNADIALRNEGQKWFQWFSKECRNLNRLSAQLVKLQALLSEGHKTVELPGTSGQVDIENRIDEIRQQIRKCEISKLKARARLQIIKDSGAEVEDFQSFELQIANEMKQQSLDVDNLNLTSSLSRTSSMRSHTELEAKMSSKSENETTNQQQRPESSSSIEQLDSPDRELLQMGTSIESTSPAPTSALYSATSAAANQTSSWGDYDPTQAWDNEPSVPPTVKVDDSYNEFNDNNNINNDNIDQQQQQINDEYGQNIDQINNDNYQQNAQETYYDDYDQQQQQQQQQMNDDQSMLVDGFSLIGKQCYALYSYQAQNDDELTIVEQEILNVINAADKDWVQAQNKDGAYGYVPATYLQELITDFTDEQYNTNLPNDISSTNNDVEQQQQQHQQQQPITTNDRWENDEMSKLPSQTISNMAISSSQQQQQQQLKTDEKTLNEQQQQQTIKNDEIFVRALYDYVATNDEEISFKSGDLIKIIDQSSDDGWWTGQNDAGQIGHFPSMLVSELGDDDDEDDESDSEEDENDEDYDGNDDAGPGKLPLPPPSIDLPPPLPPSIDINNDNYDDEKEINNEIQQPPLPPPPPPPPINEISGCDDNDKNSTSLPPLPPPPPPQIPVQPPPTIKPMQLMAPQAVVIIHPTPEIESQPVFGSEYYNNNDDDQQKNIDHQQNTGDIDNEINMNNNNNNNNIMNDKNNHHQQQQQQQQQQSVCISMAIAAHEISETIAQQAINDSMRELERRRSSATTTGSNTDNQINATSTTTTTTSQIENMNNFNATTITTTTTSEIMIVTNGEMYNNNNKENNNNDDDDEDEDMK